MTLRPATKITIIYFIVSSLWIFFSDKLLFAFGVRSQLMSFSILKGFFFIIATSYLLYKLIGTFYKKIDQRNLELLRTNLKLSESENKYASLFNLSPQPMWLYDLETYQFIQVNNAAIKHYGYSNEEFLKMNFMDLKSAEQIVKTKKEIAKQKKSTDKKVSTKSVHHTKSGEIIVVEIYATIITLNDREIGSVIAIDITEKDRHENLINKAISKAQEDERYKIGGELHDNISQILVASQLSLGLLKKSIEPNQMELFDQAKNYISLALNEIRNLSHDLAPVFYEDKTLEDAFRLLIKNMNVEEKFKVLISFEDSIKNYPLSSEIQLNLYRIMQEQVKNILKYSKASIIEIDLFIYNNVLTMRLSDNGVGFNVDTVQKGIGLANIKRRAESLAGKLRIESFPGKGCVIEILIPVKDTTLKVE